MGAYIKDNMDENLQCYLLSCSNFNDSNVYKQFEYGLKLLNENIRYFLCNCCGIKENKLNYYAFIDNLIVLRKHLNEKQNEQNKQNKLNKINSMKSINVNMNVGINNKIQNENETKSHVEDKSVSLDDNDNDIVMTDDSDEWEKI